MPFPSSTPRRLPHRTDYILIPAPLDLSLSEATEKSLLPAIIVTPSSPSSPRDFSIAFLADPPKLSLQDRIASWRHYGGGPLPFRIRYILIVLFITFALICHLAAERLAMRVPYLELKTTTQNGNDGGWIGFPVFGDTPALLHPNFIINEPSGLH
jgi:COMPASS component SWD1